MGTGQGDAKLARRASPCECFQPSNALIPDLTVRLSPHSHEVQLEWGDRAPACGYHVWRSTTADGGFADVSGLVMTSIWTDPGAAGSPDSYFYYVEID